MVAPQIPSSNLHGNTGLTSQPLKSNTFLNSSLKAELAQRPSSAPPPHKVQSAQQKALRRSSKPLINWFQRKLAGSGKAKQTENHPLAAAQFTASRNNSNLNRQLGRTASTPLPIPAVQQLKQQIKPDGASHTRRKTRSISLNGDDELRETSRQSYGPEDDISDQFSSNRDSVWSPASALEADDDASLRPLPPSGPPSPSPSRDSYLSDPHTFRSIAASTKPTTLLSIELNGGGMAHIAQVPPQTNPIHRWMPHNRQSSLGNAGLNGSASVTFSALPNLQSSSRPSSISNPGGSNPNETIAQSNGPMATVQAPLHTAHHPRNNPRPSSPPLDNASVLTLASSAFASPNRPGLLNYPPSATVGDSMSHYGGSIAFPDGESTSNYLLGDDERLEERDINASVRALRPRSSRRGSWESEASRWSAKVQGMGTSSLVRDRALWTSGSVRTGGLSMENVEVTDMANDRSPETATREIESEKDVVPEFVIAVELASPTKETSSIDATPSAQISTTSSLNLEGTQVLRRPSADTIGQRAGLSEHNSVAILQGNEM